MTDKIREVAEWANWELGMDGNYWIDKPLLEYINPVQATTKDGLPTPAGCDDLIEKLVNHVHCGQGRQLLHRSPRCSPGE